MWSKNGFVARSTFLILSVLSTSLLSTGCGKKFTDTGRGVSSSGLLGATGPSGASCANCYEDSHRQDGRGSFDKLDLLFVVDTSNWPTGVREGLTAEIQTFISSLPTNLDYRIGVMLSHAQTAFTGVLYSGGSSEPAVLSSANLSLSQIATEMGLRLTLPLPVEDETDGGEAGLVTLFNAADPVRLAATRAQGFFRTDAALAVVMMADENDLCYDSDEYAPGVTPVVDPQGIEPVARGSYCVGVNPATVYAKMRSIQGARPLLMGAAIFTNQATTPAELEAEVGYGYRKLSSIAGGIVADLANGPAVPTTLAGLAQDPVLQPPLRNRFALTLTSAQVNTASITVQVDGVAVPFTYEPATSEVVIDAGATGLKLGSVVKVGYCAQ